MASILKIVVAALLFCMGSCEYDAGVASLTSEADASMDEIGADDLITKKSVQKGDAVGAFVATDAAEEDEEDEAAGADKAVANSSIREGDTARASAAMDAAEEDELEEAAGDADDDGGEDEDGNIVQRGSYNPIHKIFKPCRGYCVSCDDEREFWHVKRSKSGITKLALAATVAGILATGGLAGGYVVAHGLAGTIGNLFVISGIKISSAAIAGLTGATYLTYNLITRNVDCPRLEFIEMHKFPPAPAQGEDPAEQKPVPKEMRYSLEDVFFEELASQMQDVGGNDIMDTPRQDMVKSQRLQSLFACAVLKNSKINLTSVSVLLPQIKETLPQYDSLFEAMVAQCSVWLCTKRPAQVKKISKLSFRQCDGAHVFTGRWWKRQARRFGLR